MYTDVSKCKNDKKKKKERKKEKNPGKLRLEAQEIEHLPSKDKALSSTPSIITKKERRGKK
jgi:hypothetical protein